MTELATGAQSPTKLVLFNENIHFLDVDFLLNLDWQYFFNAIFDDRSADALRNPLLMLTRPSSIAPIAQQLSTNPEVVFCPTTGIGGLHSVRLFLAQYYSALCSLDYVNDWRALKLERETWRSVDDLGAARRHWLSRKKYYATVQNPSTLINKVSI